MTEPIKRSRFSLILAWTLPVLVLGLGIFGTILLIQSRTPPKRIPPAKIIPLVRFHLAKPKEHLFRVETHGSVQPAHESSIVALVPGQVEWVSKKLEAGIQIKKNEILIKMDPSDFFTQIETAKAGIARAERRLAEEQKEAQLAIEEWKRSKEKGEPDPLLLRKPQIAEALADLNAAKNTLKQAQRNLARTKIKAPYDGIIDSRLVDLGTWVGPGTPLFRVFSTDAVEIRLPIRTDDLAWISLPGNLGKTGEQTRLPGVRLSTHFAGKIVFWKGHIVRMEGRIDPKSRMAHLIARVDQPFAKDPPLFPGLFVQASIEGRKVSQVFEVPRITVQEESFVTIIDKDNRLHRKKVEILKKNRDNVIIGSGIKGGQRLLLSFLETVVDGMRVRTSNKETGPGKAPENGERK
jgi:RND family efflux transporter MFP subunit